MYRLFLLQSFDNFQYFFRFTFQTIFQYLNDKEQIINSVFVKDNQIIDFPIEKYQVIQENINNITIKIVKNKDFDKNQIFTFYSF